MYVRMSILEGLLSTIVSTALLLIVYFTGLLYTVGARYISKSAYQASRDDELSFVSGAIVRLIKKYADGWWLVRYICITYR